MTSAVFWWAAFVAATYVTSCGAFFTTPVRFASTVELRCSKNVMRSYSNLGLLRGIEASTSRYYTSDLKMDSIHDVQWLKESGVLYEAAQADAVNFNITVDEYLDRVYSAMKAFQTSDEVHDREDFYAFLNNTYDRNGKFLLVLGGKSVGKSLVLADFHKQLQRDVRFFSLLADARSFTGRSLSAGILDCYQELSKSQKGAQKFVSTALNEFENVLPEGPKQITRSLGILSNLLFQNGENFPPDKVLNSFVKAAQKMNQYPVLIVDEANRVVGLGDEIRDNSKTLSKMVALTKQSKEMIVIMASTEYTYPAILEANGLNLDDISDICFAGEIPPKSMWDLLVTKTNTAGNKVIGMGENLANVLMGSYGGHFLRVMSAVDYTRKKKDVATVEACLNVIRAGVNACYQNDEIETLRLLRGMAQSGFVLVSDPDQSTVKMIVKRNLGGIVSRERAVLVSRPESAWQGNESNEKYGLVPASESTRLVMAQFVVYTEQQRLAKLTWWKRLLLWRKRR
jgi:hypothetical protein